MSGPGAKPPAPAGPTAMPVIAPLPSAARNRGPRRARGGSGRGLIWFGAFVLGLGAGVAAYAFVPDVPFYIDYWLALLLR